MHTVGPGYGKKTEKHENEIPTLFDQEHGEKHSQILKMRSTHCRTWSMARKLKIMENEKHKL